MKKFMQFFIILTLFVFGTKADLIAKEISGSLSAGEGSSFIPLQGSAFSIISDIKSGIYDGNFDILIKSGGKVIYKENSQKDDLYLVFNEPVDKGDIIKLDVVKGVFIFKMSHMSKLPDAIVNAIKEQAPKQFKKMKTLHKPKKKKSVNKRVIPAVETRVIKRHIEPENYFEPQKEETIISKPNPVESIKEAGFFDSFSEKISSLVGSSSKKDQIVSSKPVPNNISKPIVRENITKPITQQSGINNLSKSIDSVNKNISTVRKLQKSKAIDSSVTRSGIEDAASMSKVKAPKISTSGINSLPIAKFFPLDIDSKKSPVGSKSSIPKIETKVESFSTSVPPIMRENQTGLFKTQISNSALQKPKFQTQIPEPLIVKKIKIEESISKPRVKEITKIDPIPEPEMVKYVEREVVSVPPVQEIIEPEIVERPYVQREATKDRIVITKTIATPKKKKIEKEEPRVIKRHVEPQDYKAEQEQIPQRMSERVSGNGFGMSASGKIKVKAYSNNRPVSAWVEVFKAGTSQRVKTFYTGKGGSLKDIKLPAGIYVIKATYRTATSKRKKTIGRVILEEGGNINKSISFDDGTIRVKVYKAGEPVYAKVEVFKSGSSRRIAYEFTSKSKGVATLSLGSGTYDIVIKDHSNVKRFDSVRVRGGKRKTLNADF